MTSTQPDNSYDNRVEIEITPEDLQSGLKCSAKNCPAGLAIKRYFNIDWVNISCDGGVTFPSGFTIMSRDVSTFVRTFDTQLTADLDTSYTIVLEWDNCHSSPKVNSA